MRALHAAWGRDGRLHLWAEDAAVFEARRPRASRRRGTPRHPWAVEPSGADLAAAAAEPDALEAPAGAAATLSLLLPSAGRAPLPSPRIGPAGGEEAELRPWTVPTRAFAPRQAVALLAALTGPGGARATEPHDPTLAWLRAAALAAADLVARGRFVPAIVAGGTGPEARWLPVPATTDIDRLRALARAIPPACRAETTTAHAERTAADDAPTGRTTADLVTQLLGDVVDALAREAAAGALAIVRRPRTAVDAWLAALAADDPRILGNPAGLAELTAALETWRAGATDARAFRTCFRLAPPKDEAGAWNLEILLQAADDPSLLVPAGDVWAGAVAPSGREDPGERLLRDLGRASRLHPPLEAALAQARPASVAFDVTGAHAFLREGAPILAEAGFGIQAPAWWNAAARRRLAARLRARTAGASGTAGPGPAASGAKIGQEALVEFDWEIALGDATLTAEEIRDLARQKAPLVQVRGEWIELRPDELDAAARLAEQDAPGTMTAGRALRIGLGLEPAATGGLEVDGVVADGWLADLLTGAHAGAEAARERTTPEGFDGALRPYQLRGLAWLEFLGRAGLGACLADDMGLGKTAQVLALLAEEAPAPAPTLVICPMSVAENWRREAARFVPGLRVHVHHGASRLTGAALTNAATNADLVITTYNLVARDIADLASIEWGRLVLDEAQNVKNHNARQAQAVRRIRAPRRIALTGTPVENRLSELWSIMEVLNPGLLGNATAFHTRFAVPIERYQDADAAERLRRATSPFVLRRLKSDRSIIADLPDKLEMTEHCALTREQATLYQAVVDEMLERIESSEGIERRGLVLATMLKLKQVCNHPAHLLGDGSALGGRSGKLARVEEILEEVLADGERALLFTQFAEFGSMLRGHLRDRFGREVLFLHGGVPKRERDSMVARFSAGEAGGPSIFILSLKAGGTGLNLVAANHVIHVDRWWNPAVEDQATDRAFRIGQTKNVQVRKLVCTGTLEDRIATMLDEKRALAASVVGTGETWLTELSNAELRSLVALSADVTGGEE